MGLCISTRIPDYRFEINLESKLKDLTNPKKQESNRDLMIEIRAGSGAIGHGDRPTCQTLEMTILDVVQVRCETGSLVE